MAYDSEFVNPNEGVKKALIAATDMPPAKRTNCGTQPIVNKISTLATLNELEQYKDELCCETQVVSRKGKIVSSSCRQKCWTEWERANINSHFCFYILCKFGSLEKLVRIFYIVLTFAYKLRRKIDRCSLCTAESKSILQNHFL